MRFLPIISFYFLSLSLSGQASFEITKEYNISDGLSHNYVLRIREDSRGFLWVGTWEGLNRFDGQDFKKYYHERNNPNSLPHDLIWDILEYQPGMLLIATPNGLGVLNTLTGQFENDKIQFAQLKAGSKTTVTKLERGPDGNVWVNHSGELDVLDKNLKYLYRFTDLDWAKSIKGISLYLEDLVTDQGGRIWVPSDSSGIMVIDMKAERIMSYKNNPDDLPYFKHKLIRSLLLEGDSILWVSQWGQGIIKYDLRNGKKLLSLFAENENSFDEIIRTSKGHFLLTMEGNCYEFNPNTLTASRLFEFGEDSSSGQSTGISSLTFSSTNPDTYWVGATAGLFKINKKIPRTEINLANEPAWNINTAIFTSRTGYVYLLGGEKSILEVDSTRQMVKRYTTPFSMTVNTPASIAEDAQNKLWLGSENGVRRFDPQTKKFDLPPFLPDQLKTAKIRAIFCDMEGNLWISTKEPLHLFRVNPASQEFNMLPDSILLPFSSTGPMGQIEKIKEDIQGNLWMHSQVAGGILCFNKINNTWSHFPKSRANKVFIEEIGLDNIWLDTTANVWLTRVVGDGLVRYDYVHDSIFLISREDGLLSNDIIDFTNDDNNNLWLSSPFGIARFSIPERKVKGHFTLDYSSGFNEYGVHFDRYSEELILTGNDKMIFVNPDRMMDSIPPPAPILDVVKVNNTYVQFDSQKHELILNHSQRNISIDFTAIHFSNTEKLQFAYTLSGEDDEWTHTTNLRNAQYTLLSPGKYVFKVRVADGSGEWTDSYNLLTFTIKPPFWRSTWFLAITILVSGFAAFAVFKGRIRSIRQKAELKTKVVETEMMALRAQMNPHFIFNCINSIDSLIQSNDKYQATIYLNKFAKLIRNILDSSKLNRTTLAKDLETLKLYIELEQFRNENKFTAEVIADPSLLQGDYKVPPLVIQPYVENAIIHGLRTRPDNGGQLKVTVTRTNGYIRYVIEDNGVGRKNTLQEHPGEKKSYGMEISSERIRLFNQEDHASVTITDLEDAGMPKGTRVEVHLKMI